MHKNAVSEPSISTSLHLILEAELQARLGQGSVVVCSGVDGDPNTLWLEERLAVMAAIPRRQQEFAAGRMAARLAMRRLNRRDQAIPCQSDRSPRWPEDLVGSISHTSSVCVVVLGAKNKWQSIGVDIEPETGIEESLWSIVCSPEEQSELLLLPPSARAGCVKRLFVAKEAFYKWHYPLNGSILDFQDVTVKWAPDGSAFATLLTSRGYQEGEAECRGTIASIQGMVVACCMSEATAPRDQEQDIHAHESA